MNLLEGLLDGLFPEFTQVFKNPCGKTALTVLSLCAVPEVMSLSSVSVLNLWCYSWVGMMRRKDEDSYLNMPW
jgi:hypothetical protein